MSTRQLLTTLLLTALAEVALLAAFVFIDEPQRAGGAPPHFHAADIAYLALPFVLAAAAAATPLRLLLRRRRREQA